MSKDIKIKQALPKLARHIQDELIEHVGPGTGFCLYVFDTAEGMRSAQYVTNVPADVVEASMSFKKVEISEVRDTTAEELDAMVPKTLKNEFYTPCIKQIVEEGAEVTERPHSPCVTCKHATYDGLCTVLGAEVFKFGGFTCEYYEHK